MVIRCNGCTDTYCSPFCAKTMGATEATGKLCHFCQCKKGMITNAEYKKCIEEKIRIHRELGHRGPSDDEVRQFLRLLMAATLTPDQR